MIIYLIKSTFLLLIFAAIYKVSLDKKKALKFKRFFLLFSVCFALLFPLINFQYQVESNPIIETKGKVIEQMPVLLIETFENEPTTDFNYIKIAYLIITAFFILNFLKNIIYLWKLKRKSTHISTQFGTIALHAKVKSPFSFYNTIFVNFNDWQNAKIDDAILHHEQAHVLQKHTLDVLFIEILKTVMWFQPFLFIFKRFIQENHEYLADQVSLNKSTNIKHYQNLILNYYNTTETVVALSSSIHFNNLKKRFIMMKNTKKAKVWSSIFYTTTALITYFGFVGIEAKASEILYFENEVLNLNKPIHNISSQTLNNIDTLKTKSEISEKVFVVSDSLKSKVKITFKENGFYSSFVEINKQKLNYVVDDNKKVTFYDDKGNIVKIGKDEYKLVDLFSEDITYFSSSYSVRYNGIVDKENYTKIAEPLIIDEKNFIKDFTDIIVKKIEKSKEKKRYDIIMTFDIDTNGDIVNVQNLSTAKFDVEEHLKKYLYSQQKWAPSEINSEKVVSTYKIHFLARINYSIKEMSEEDNKKTPQN